MKQIRNLGKNLTVLVLICQRVSLSSHSYGHLAITVTFVLSLAGLDIGLCNHWPGGQ